MSTLSCPILVVSYSAEARAAMVASIICSGAIAVPCATFCEAENLALEGKFNGLLVDLPSIIKSKGEEKIVAYTLANFFPTLRVRAMGSMLIPMTMPGSGKQESSVDDFLTKSCPKFSPRALRAHKRHMVCLFTLVKNSHLELKGFTLDISWGGVFIVDVEAERLTVGEEVSIYFPEFKISVPAEVRSTRAWGIKRLVPGFGLRFNSLEDSFVTVLSGITKTSRDIDRDRLSA